MAVLGRMKADALLTPRHEGQMAALGNRWRCQTQHAARFEGTGEIPHNRLVIFNMLKHIATNYNIVGFRGMNV